MDKVIGVFGEIDGIERESFVELRKELGLIGSVSDDVGNVKVYYTNEGKNYVIAHNCERYYGDKNAKVGDIVDILFGAYNGKKGAISNIFDGKYVIIVEGNLECQLLLFPGQFKVCKHEPKKEVSAKKEPDTTTSTPGKINDGILEYEIINKYGAKYMKITDRKSIHLIHQVCPSMVPDPNIPICIEIPIYKDEFLNQDYISFNFDPRKFQIKDSILSVISY
jgi:hypothetical protein